MSPELIREAMLGAAFAAGVFGAFLVGMGARVALKAAVSLVMRRAWASTSKADKNAMKGFRS